MTGKSYNLQANMPDKAAKQSVEEVGVLPLLDSKNPRTWWYVFSACLLLTFSTRLYKVSHSVIGRDDGRLLKMVAYAHPSWIIVHYFTDF